MGKKIPVKYDYKEVGYVVVDDDGDIVVQNIDHKLMSEEDQARFFRDGLDAYVYKEDADVYALEFKSDPEPEPEAS